MFKRIATTFLNKYIYPFKAAFAKDKLSIKKFPFLEIVLVMLFPLSQYEYGFSNIGFLVATFVCLLFIIVKRELWFYKPFVLFLLYFIIINFFAFFISDDKTHLLNLFVSLFGIAVCIFSFSTFLDKRKLIWVWTILGVIACLGIFYHEFCLDVLNQEYVTIIKILPNSKGYLAERFLEHSKRPLSFFLEPASFVTFIVPPLFFSFYKRRYLLTVVFSLAILFSGSIIGLIYVVIFVFIYFLSFWMSSKRKAILLTLFIAIVASFVLILLFVPAFDSIKNKIAIELSGSGSFAQRIISGFSVYANLSPKDQLFGIPYNDLEEYLKRGFAYIPDIKLVGGLNYASSVSFYLIRYGVFGLIFFLALLVAIFNSIEKKYYPYFVVVIVSFFSQSEVFNPIFIVIFSILLLFANNTLSSKNKLSFHEVYV